MNILLKCPTRSRPQKVLATLGKYIQLAKQKHKLGIAVSCDEDDTSMTRNLVKEELERTMKTVAWSRVFYGSNKSKIQACNANMSEIDYAWDIVVLVSDDMIPQIMGWDDVIRSHMMSRFPDTNGILWFNDGHQGDKLNTLSIYGRRMYEEFGYLYQPDYKSLFCDTELTDRCRTDLKDRCLYVPYCIIRHEHPGTGYAQNNDALYQHNNRFWWEDMMTYIRRKNYAYDWTVMIATIPGREQKLQSLLASVREKVGRIAPELRLEICLDFDNRESSIGDKRHRLLQRAAGKYLCFIDDDDDITDAYVEDAWSMIRGNFHTMRLRGQIGNFQFLHSLSIKLTDPMATKETPAIFQRPPNHLNPMLADIAKCIPFKSATYGEDLDWTMNLSRTGFLQTEYRHEDEKRIHYIYNTSEPIHAEALHRQQNMSYQEMLDHIFTPANRVPRPTTVEPGPKPLRLTSRGFVSK
jgi:hypothetical protein